MLHFSFFTSHAYRKVSQCHLIDKITRIGCFVFFRNISAAFWRNLTIFFSICLQILRQVQKTFMKRLYLWTKVRYWYIFVVYLSPSAGENVFRENWPKIFDCRKCGKKNRKNFFPENKWYFFDFGGPCWMTSLVLLSYRWNIFDFLLFLRLTFFVNNKI